MIDFTEGSHDEDGGGDVRICIASSEDQRENLSEHECWSRDRGNQTSDLVR
jgi:hypothetical protein